ncbi:hypothetical protein Vi05172_g7840 [Venturia inaequalis]|nr:hypothetical protein Vi05172_g7840 [Venturia inaequalis]
MRSPSAEPLSTWAVSRPEHLDGGVGWSFCGF